jgi:putative Holliday junction resolvase
VKTRGRILAIDYGEKNIGFACSDALGIIVRPLPSVPNSGRKEFIRTLSLLISEMGICGLIMGIPLNMDGSQNDSVRRIKQLMRKLETSLKLPLTGVDERLSTLEAMEYWNRLSVRQKKKYRTVDSLAAALILDRYLKEH